MTAIHPSSAILAKTGSQSHARRRVATPDRRLGGDDDGGLAR